MADKKISAAVIKRLPRYYRYLSELLDNGIERISSGELSKQMKVTASQIRQDFNNFGGFGQQGYGYNVPYLKNEIGKILGLDRDYHVIILGAGNLGHLPIMPVLKNEDLWYRQFLMSVRIRLAKRLVIRWFMT